MKQRQVLVAQAVKLLRRKSLEESLENGISRKYLHVGIPVLNMGDVPLV